MILGVKDETVVRVDQTLGISPAARIVDVTLVIAAPALIRELSVVIAEAGTADTHTGKRLAEIPLAETEALFLGFFLQDEILRELPVCMEVKRDLIARGIASVLADAVSRLRTALRRPRRGSTLLCGARLPGGFARKSFTCLCFGQRFGRC